MASVRWHVIYIATKEKYLKILIVYNNKEPVIWGQKIEKNKSFQFDDEQGLIWQ